MQSFRRAGLFLCLAGLALPLSADSPPVVLKSLDQKVVEPLDLARLHRLGLAAFRGTAGDAGGFLTAFDRRLDSAYVSKSPGRAELDVAFARPQALHSVRVLPGDTPFRWSLAAADTQEELEKQGAGYRVLIPLRETAPRDWTSVSLPAGTMVGAVRLVLEPADPKLAAVLRECNLVAEQTLQSLSVESKEAVAPLGELVPLRVTGYFSGGSTLPVGGNLKWIIRPPAAARMSTHRRIVAQRTGPFEVSVQLDRMVSPPLPLEGIEGN